MCEKDNDTTDEQIDAFKKSIAREAEYYRIGNDREQLIAGVKMVDGKLEPYGVNESGNFRDLRWVVDNCSPVVRYTKDLGKYLGAVGKRVAGTNIIFGGMTSTPDIHREIWKIEIELWATVESRFCFYEETDVFDYSSGINK